MADEASRKLVEAAYNLVIDNLYLDCETLCEVYLLKLGVRLCPINLRSKEINHSLIFVLLSFYQNPRSIHITYQQPINGHC